MPILVLSSKKILIPAIVTDIIGPECGYQILSQRCVMEAGYLNSKRFTDCPLLDEPHPAVQGCPNFFQRGPDLIM